ncbi:MAG TPA: beta-galactosidase trimerization domain-containing protein [bacterium]|nr:beta-galactosidase trimerization domain-containing protein [bacterium]HPP30528.1 beta-galactosidase trimerization domain-containing protein [bacterium]
MIKKADWFKTGIAFTGYWEPLMVLRRWGRAGEDTLKMYEEAHREETFRFLAKCGINLFITHFHKGFGMEAEKEEMEYVRQQVRFCHKYGIKIGLYFRIDNVIGETFFRDIPEAKNWIAVNQYGEVVRYGTSSWRQRICFNEPAYRQYAKRVIRYALLNIGADALFFDGMTGRLEYDTCRCERCREGFKKYLLNKWNSRRKEAREYFGHDYIEGIEIPEWYGKDGIALRDAIVEPEIQEWIRYKCALFADFHNDIAGYVYSLKPDALILSNAGIQLWINAPAYLGVYLPSLCDGNEIVMHEDGHFPDVRKDGILCHRIREYKAGETLGKRVAAYCHFSDKTYFLRAVCESLAFNGGHFGHIGHLEDLFHIVMDKGKLGYVQRIFNWGREHSDIYRDSESRSEVAILRSFSSMTFNCRMPWRDTILIEQILIQKHIPFDIIFDEQLDSLKRYKLLILGSQVCIGRENIHKIINYVKNGGKLFITGETANFDENYRRYIKNPFLHLVKNVDAIWIKDVIPGVKKEIWFPAWQFNPKTGRFIISGENPSTDLKEYPFCNWALPENTAEIFGKIVSMADLSILIETSSYVAVNWTRKNSWEREYLHFINYDNENIVSKSKVFVKKGVYKKFVFHRFDPDTADIEIIQKHGRKAVIIPEFQTYGILELIK